MSIDTQLHVRARGRQPFLYEEREEACLEATAHNRSLLSRFSPRNQDPAQARCPATTSQGKDPLDLIDIELPENRCLLDQAPHRAPTRPPSHVHERPGDGRAGNSLADLELVGRWQAHPVRADAIDLAARPIRRNHMDDGKLLVPQAL